jgi:NDP-hexose 3,5-(Or5-) epimerase
MSIEEMKVRDAFRITPSQLPDNRGRFFEAWRIGELTELSGQPFTVKQVNFSVSHRNTLRGIHGTTLPPGQAKLVTCVRGAALDVVVDLRVGSPTFGMFDTTLQEADSGIPGRRPGPRLPGPHGRHLHELPLLGGVRPRHDG